MMDPSSFIIVPSDPEEPAALRLLALSDSYLQSLYPAESNHLESAAALKKANVIFLGGLLGAELVACGAVKLLNDEGSYGEIKRLFVVEAHRGRGLAQKIMLRLEGHLCQAGIPLARLETGIRQPDAIGMYRRLGYVERTPFGGYKPDPLSIFMEKLLDPV